MISNERIFPRLDDSKTVFLPTLWTTTFFVVWKNIIAGIFFNHWPDKESKNLTQWNVRF